MWNGVILIENRTVSTQMVVAVVVCTSLHFAHSGWVTLHHEFGRERKPAPPFCKRMDAVGLNSVHTGNTGFRCDIE